MNASKPATRENKFAWPRWDHQSHELEEYGDRRGRAQLWPMRSGKSRTVIDVACRQFKSGKIRGAIIIAPNGVHLNWALNEIPTWADPSISSKVFAWETTKFRAMEQQWRAFLQHPGLRWLCVPMDALMRADNAAAIKLFLDCCGRKFFLGVSEAHHFGRPGAKRTHRLRSLAWHADFVRIETGTPILTGPLKAFSIYEALAPGALGFDTFKEFKEYYAEFEDRRRGNRNYEHIVGYRHLPQLRSELAKWSSVVLRSDLGDMPELIRTERPVVMSEKQRTAYTEMVTKFLIDTADGAITAKEGGARMLKLQQILSGWIGDSDTGQIHEIDADAPIYEAAIDEIEGTFPGKALVWCRFKEDCRRLTAKLRANKRDVLEYWGDFNADVRERNRAKFLSPDDDSVMIGTADCGGEGLDFSAADAVIFFSGNPNARMMAQAEERATVKGGKNVASVRIRNYGTVCDRIWEIVDGNVSLADTITGRGLRELLLATSV